MYKKKIHFMAPISGNKARYRKIANLLTDHNNEIVTNHCLEKTEIDLVQESEEESAVYFQNIFKWIRTAHVVVFETTVSDISIGFEIRTALDLYKPVIILFDEKVGNIPCGIRGSGLDRLQIIPYTIHNLEKSLSRSKLRQR